MRAYRRDALDVLERWARTHNDVVWGMREGCEGTVTEVREETLGERDAKRRRGAGPSVQGLEDELAEAALRVPHSMDRLQRSSLAHGATVLSQRRSLEAELRSATEVARKHALRRELRRVVRLRRAELAQLATRRNSGCALDRLQNSATAPCPGIARSGCETFTVGALPGSPWTTNSLRHGRACCSDTSCPCGHPPDPIYPEWT